jgi:predicted transposase YdaD
MKTRLAGEPDRNTVAELWTATKVLLGLRYDAPFIEGLLQGVLTMKESTTYQAIVEEGRQEGRQVEARRMLLQLGEHRFGGPPGESERAALEAIASVEELERLILRLLDVETWTELLSPPAGATRRPRRKKP